MVERLQGLGLASDAAVAEAMRTVPRHRFVPDAYANTPVHVKHTADGTSISCASQPSVVARMLDQLDVGPGHRILELGTGTGYNAALLAHLVGSTGRVTTIDVDDDLVEGARAHLGAAGYRHVDTVLGDGALGHPEAAPYDRIIATVGAHAIPQEWLDQLAPDGRLVVPQRLIGSVCRSIAYQRHDGRWRSVDSAMNTFMPMRRGSADDPRQFVALNDDTIRLQAPASNDVDHEALTGVLHRSRTEVWTVVAFEAEESPEWMELFVAGSLPGGLMRMLFPASAKGGLLADDPYRSSGASVDGGGFAYLARRPLAHTVAHGEQLWEFGVIGHGDGHHALAATVAEAIQTWDRDYRGQEATFELLALDTLPTEPRPRGLTLTTPANRILVDWELAKEPLSDTTR